MTSELAVTERAAAGRNGAFPTRFPIGATCALIVGCLLIPACWNLGLACAPRLQRFYLRTYFTTLRDSYFGQRRSALMGGRKPVVIGTYSVLFDGSNLAVQQALDERPENIHEGTIQADPVVLHDWLQKTVYAGSAATVFRLPVTFVVLMFGGLLVAGWEVDKRRRAKGRDGVHRRGTQLVSWQRFNRQVLRQTWWRKGLKPGIQLRVGRRGEYVTIPRELESYHFNFIGTTGMGKTTLLRELAYQIKARGEVMVVYDPKQEFYKEFFEDGGLGG